MAKPKKLYSKCHICEQQNQYREGEAVPEVCGQCGADLVNNQNEIILKSTSCQYSFKKGSGDIITLNLTNKRLVGVIDSSQNYGQIGGIAGGAIGGLIGGLADAATAGKLKNKWGFSLPLEDIVSFEDGKFGLLVKAYIVKMKDGASVKLSANAKKKAEWVEAIKAAKEKLAVNV